MRRRGRGEEERRHGETLVREIEETRRKFPRNEKEIH